VVKKVLRLPGVLRLVGVAPCLTLRKDYSCEKSVVPKSL